MIIVAAQSESRECYSLPYTSGKQKSVKTDFTVNTYH